MCRRWLRPWIGIFIANTPSISVRRQPEAKFKSGRKGEMSKRANLGVRTKRANRHSGFCTTHLASPQARHWTERMMEAKPCQEGFKLNQDSRKRFPILKPMDLD